MRLKKQPHWVKGCWAMTVLICLALTTGGFILLLNGIRAPHDGGFWFILGGLSLIVAGLATGYFVSVRCFWAMVSMIVGQNFATQKGRAARGPKIVVVGGGTGLGTILRGLKEITSHLTAVVTVADDGGSSGRLREEFGILPPGDIRNCLVAMADIEPLMERLMQYRFSGNSGLAGHNFGNLFLTAMTDITGDFEQAIRESSKVLAVRGQVLPATLENVILKAEMTDGRIVTGESAISGSKLTVRKVFLEPADVKPLREAVSAINEADLIVLGPGSLYTSVIPNLLVKEIAEAIRNSNATKIYICNAMTQPGETDGYSASDHLRAIIEHAGPGLVDIAVLNTAEIPAAVLSRYAEEGAAPVKPDFDKVKSLGIVPLGAEIITKTSLIRHDARKLARMVLKFYRTQQLSHALGKRVMSKVYRMFKVLSGLFLTR